MRNLLRIAMAFAAVLLLQMGQSSKAQIFFQEHFTTGMPGTFTLYNVDNLTPATAVNYVNQAWIVREDFITPSDSCAFSTSWYTPAGTANDWMVTPAIVLPATGNVTLSWEGMSPDPSYRDGYQVRIANSSSLTAQQAGAILFSTTAEPTTWTPHSVSLNAYLGQTVYISFRNNSNDKFILMIDDIVVQQPNNYDARILTAAAPSEYTQIPASQASPVNFSADIINQGLLSVTGVVLNVTVRDGLGATVYTNNSTTTASLASGATVTKTVPSWTPSGISDYTIHYDVNIVETDANLGNDTLNSLLSITDSTFARDDNTVAGVLGIGAGTPGELGQVYELENPASVSSVSFFIGNGNGSMVNQPINAVIRAFNGVPGAILAYTDTLIMDTSTNVLVTLPISGGPLSLPADTFFVGVVEGDSNITLGYSNDIFLNGIGWVDFPGNPFGGWANNEDYSFNVVYIVRPNIQPNCPPFSFTQVSNPATCGQSDGNASVTVSGGTGPYTYSWSNGGNTANITNLSSGLYICTVTDNVGCSDTAQVNVSNLNGPTLSGLTISDVDCNGNSTGSATANVTGGTPPYSYVWSNGGTTQTINGLASGTYTVTITDSLGCVLNGTANVTQPTALTATSSATDESCTGCADGTASVTATGGTSPYTYLWSNGGTASSIGSLSAGTYTVTITDANGCTTTQTATVGVMISNGQVLNNTASIELFPNPSNGNFTLMVQLPKAGVIEYELMDITGKIVASDRSEETSQFQQEFNLRNSLAKGSYLVRIKVGEAQYLRKLVIE